MQAPRTDREDISRAQLGDQFALGSGVFVERWKPKASSSFHELQAWHKRVTYDYEPMESVIDRILTEDDGCG